MIAAACAGSTTRPMAMTGRSGTATFTARAHGIMAPSGEPMEPMPGHPLTSRKSASFVARIRLAISTPSSRVWPPGLFHAPLMRTPTTNGRGQASRTAREDLEHESQPVLEAAAVLVAPPVSPGREPDAEQVRVRGVDLDPVHAGSPRRARRLHEPGDQGTEIGGVHLLAHLAVGLGLAGGE